MGQYAIEAVLDSIKDNAFVVEAEAPEYSTRLPGCLFEADEKGLNQIANHRLIHHIGYKPKCE